MVAIEMYDSHWNAFDRSIQMQFLAQLQGSLIKKENMLYLFLN